jgi:hypothetical protein
VKREFPTLRGGILAIILLPGRQARVFSGLERLKSGLFSGPGISIMPIAA